MFKRILAGILALFISFRTPPVRADLAGGDVIVLAQILANAIEQLIQLRDILSSTQDNLSLLQSVNYGLNTILRLFTTISPRRDPGIYKDLVFTPHAKSYLENIYGYPSDSSERLIQHQTSQSIAEIVTLNNAIHEYTKEIDRIGEDFKRASGSASPKGAAKLTAQSLGVVLHVLSQSLRTQAMGLKLQAQAMAVQNHKDIELSNQVRQSSDQLYTAMAAANPRFALPRF